MNINDFIKTLNEWGRQHAPFLFIVDFEMQKPLVFKIPEINEKEILFDINGITNAQPKHKISGKDELIFRIDGSANSLNAYQAKFDLIKYHLNQGNSFLTNLTIKTKIETNKTLRELFFLSEARYKLWYREEFLVYSPEIFIQIRDQRIFSYPMKGTIDAAIPNAKEIILQNEKELAEHVTIVDLMRNDLSIVANSVQVSKFRYVEEVKTNSKNLLQVSSEIQGDLKQNYFETIGSLLFSLLPAGSVSGAPKKKTLEIIQNSESEPRGYYTGIFGYFDGKNLDAGVMIRFIENNSKGLFYRSGGGITTQSLVEQEYQEAINKIYAPVY